MSYARNMPYEFSVAAGYVEGASVVFLSGTNLDIDTATVPETIWKHGGAYPWSAWDSGVQTLYIASDSASDIGTITLNGLDANYDMQSQTITMTGTTAVNTGGTQYIRLNSSIYINTTNNIGNITIRTANASGTIVGYIAATDGISSGSYYTVPNGHTAFSTYGDFSVNSTDGAQMVARWRFGGTGGFSTVYTTQVTATSFAASPPFPGAIPQKTDIDNQVVFAVNNNERASSNQQLILIDNEYL